MSSPVPGPPLIDSTAAAGKALCDFFLANADRGDNTANDELVAELVRRICAQQGSSSELAPTSGPRRVTTASLE